MEPQTTPRPGELLLELRSVSADAQSAWKSREARSAWPWPLDLGRGEAVARVLVDLEGHEASYRGKRRGSGRQMTVRLPVGPTPAEPERPWRL